MRLLAAAALVLCGCGTSLEVDRVGPQSPAVMRGISYPLPALTYGIVVTRELVDCGAEGSEPGFQIGVEIARRYGPGEIFVIDPTRMTNWHKTSKAELSFYDNGVLKAFNAGMVDRSPEIAAAATVAAFAIARLALGAPSGIRVSGETGGAGPSGVRKPAFVCLCETRDTLAQIASYGDIERKLSEELEAAVRKLEPLRQAAMMGALSEAEKKMAASLITKIADLIGRMGQATAARDELRADLTLRQSHEIAPAPSAQSAGAELSPHPEPLRQWSKKLFDPTLTPEDKRLDDLTVILTMVAVWTAVDRPQVHDKPGQQDGAGEQGRPVAISQDDEAQIEGLAYRDPARVRLLVCQTTTQSECASGAKEALAQSVDAAPQLGRLMLLPLRNGFGEDTELAAQFAPDGRLLKVTYDSRKASGERAMGVVTGALGEAETFAAARAKAQADVRTAETAALDQRVRALKTQRDLLDAEAALGQEQILAARRLEQMNQEILQLEAEKKVRELRQALADARN